MNVLDLVGNTPVIELKNISNLANGVSLFAKAEYFNPSGSVKDRAAKAMMLHGINSGQLTKDKILLDSTSGNTGIAYAMFGAALGYRVKLFMPSNASEERKKIMRAYGAEIIETDPLEGSDGAYRIVMELAQKSRTCISSPTSTIILKIRAHIMKQPGLSCTTNASQRTLSPGRELRELLWAFPDGLKKLIRPYKLFLCSRILRFTGLRE